MAQKMVDERKRYMESLKSLHIKEELSNTKCYELYYSKSYKDHVLSFNSCIKSTKNEYKKFIITKSMWKKIKKNFLLIDYVLKQ